MAKHIRVQVINANGEDLGKQQITITCYDSVIHDRKDYGLTEYFFTGNTGLNVEKLRPVKEYVSVSDSRIWLSTDHSFIVED